MNDSGPDALDDARVDLPVEGLRAAAIVGVHAHDRGPGLGAGDALRDGGLHMSGMLGWRFRLQGPFNAASIQILCMGQAFPRRAEAGRHIAFADSAYDALPQPRFRSGQAIDPARPLTVTFVTTM